jgi:hypothetical protein
MRRKEYSLGDKMLVNSLRLKTSLAREAWEERKDHYKSSTLHVVPSRSNDIGNILS